MRSATMPSRHGSTCGHWRSTPCSTKCSQQGDQLELVLRDHGPGLPAQFDGRWFEPYMSTKPKGGGLGLAMVQKIAEEHGGQIRAENAEAGGARFVLILPITRAPA